MQRGGDTVTPKVAAGDAHTVVLKSDGTVWAAGINDVGQLGVGDAVASGSSDSKTANFTQCVDSNGQAIGDATDVACGRFHTAIIRSNGEVWQCGNNSSGQLGNNSKKDSPVFVKSSNITGATQIVCGSVHTAVIVNGEVWQCGANNCGQLGNSSTTNSSVFVQSANITGATQIACGSYHTAVILDNGEVWQCGSNYKGQLGNTSVAVGSGTQSAIFVQSLKYTNGSSGSTEAITGATQISCGNEHTAALLNNGEVWQCGSNSSGQLGNMSVGTGSDGISRVFTRSYKSKTGDYFASPTNDNIEAISEAEQIACGSYHTAVLLNNGEVWQCGSNGSGQLGNVAISTGSSDCRSRVFIKSQNITNARELSTGSWASFTMALCAEKDSNYELYGVGWNYYGQLGLNNYTTYITTVTKSTTISDIGVYIVPDIEAIAALGESSSRDASGAGQFIGGYGLQIEWSDLQYKYTAEWNVDESKWVDSWKPTNENGDQIVVKNASAVPCKVEFAFGTNDEFKGSSETDPGTKGTFTDPNVADEPALDTIANTVPLAVYTAATPATSQKTVKLGLEGIPNAKAGINIDEAKTVGSVTVTLKSSDA